MSELVAPDQIEELVGARRHSIKHLGRMDTAAGVVHILHSEWCRRRVADLRTCAFSIALDAGIDVADWVGWHDRPIVLGVDPYGTLCPWALAANRAESAPWPDHSEPITVIDQTMPDPRRIVPTEENNHG